VSFSVLPHDAICQFVAVAVELRGFQDDALSAPLMVRAAPGAGVKGGGPRPLFLPI